MRIKQKVQVMTIIRNKANLIKQTKKENKVYSIKLMEQGIIKRP